MTPDVQEILYVVPKVRAEFSISFEEEDDEEFDVDIPEEEILMVTRRRRSRGGGDAKPARVKDILPELIGDGNMRVTVPVDIGEKKYGNGYSAGMVVSVTCNQSRESVEQAQEVARDIIREFLPDIASDAFDLFEEKRRLRKKKGGRLSD
jgi:hypothetical protein